MKLFLFFGDNDIKGTSESDIVAKVYDEKKKKWEGHRTGRFLFLVQSSSCCQKL